MLYTVLLGAVALAFALVQVLGKLKGIVLALGLLFIYLRKNKHLYLELPNGFIPYLLLGGGNVPPYFAFDAFLPENIDSWCRDGDVIVSSGAKSGTNWLLYTCHLIRTRG